ncbi:ParA family protein [Nocardia sp. NPDC049220]|uniref:ParA family protein n=1 Tax=Nocardia sp. NPDC049220 TaxID=3155273 RepID=UPI0033D4849E
MADLASIGGFDCRHKGVAVLSSKGGVGKSTLCGQIIDNLARFGLRVLGVDLDPNGALSAMTNTVAPIGGPSVKEVLEGTVDPRAAIIMPGPWQPESDRRWDRGGQLLPEGEVHILPAPQDGLENAIRVSGTDAESRLHIALTNSGLGEYYDAMILDAPGTEGPAFFLSLHAALHVLFPLQPETLSLRGFIRTIDKAVSFSSYSGKKLNAIGGVATMMTNKREHREVVEDADAWLKKRFNGQVAMLTPSLPLRVVVADAVPLYLPVSRMVTSGGTHGVIAAGYSRIALSVINVVAPERMDGILDALEDADLDPKIKSVLFGEADADDAAELTDAS